MAFKEDVDSQLILTIGAISGLMVIVAAIGLQAWFMTEEQREFNQKSATSINYELTNMNDAQTKNIMTYRWVDADKKVAAMPIDQAMKVLIQNNGRLPSTQPKP